MAEVVDGPDLSAAGGGPEVPPKSDLDEAFNRGRRAGRQEAARVIREHIASYPITDGRDRSYVRGMDWAGRLAEGDTDGT